MERPSQVRGAPARLRMRAHAVGAERCRMTVGDNRVNRLRAGGATDKYLAEMYDGSRAPRASGVGNRDAMKQAEDGTKSAVRTRAAASDAPARKVTKAASGKPRGMTESTYARYRSDGFSDSEIRNIWKDTLETRKRMKQNAGKPERYITFSTYENVQRRLNRDVDRWFGRGHGLMGGRGVSSGFYKLNGKANVYGDEYASVMASLGRIKIVAQREGKAMKAPVESMTPGRVYATANKETGELHSLSYIGSDGKAYKQVDYQDHKGMDIHAHDISYDDKVKLIRSDSRKASRNERNTAYSVRRYVQSKGGAG